MKRIKKHVCQQFLLSLVFAFIFYIFVLPLACYCYEPVQTITITKEDIINAKPVSPYEVQFSQKDLKKIRMMEKRHFPRTYDELEDRERLSNLEYELLGRKWEFTPQNDRIKKLEIASSNRMIIGTALPASISTKRNAKRMRNQSIPIREKDNVGLIDGFLRLMNPELYDNYRKRSDFLFENFEY